MPGAVLHFLALVMEIVGHLIPGLIADTRHYKPLWVIMSILDNQSPGIDHLQIIKIYINITGRFMVSLCQVPVPGSGSKQQEPGPPPVDDLPF